MFTKKKALFLIILLSGTMFVANSTEVQASCTAAQGTTCTINSPQISGGQQRGRVTGRRTGVVGDVSARVTHFGNSNVATSGNWTSGLNSVTAHSPFIPVGIGSVTTSGRTAPGS